MRLGLEAWQWMGFFYGAAMLLLLRKVVKLQKRVDELEIRSPQYEIHEKPYKIGGIVPK